MDDIYGDLRNYEDVNTAQELRNENKELKVKLEEHSAAMAKLQKQILQDYDTLEMEFRKLETNYSSLLKTARSEIERKTQRISQLNLEKDLMVISAFKDGKNIRRNFNRGAPNQSKIRNEKPFKGKGNQNIKEDDVKQKNESCKTNTQYTKVELSIGRKSNTKENITHHETDTPNDTPKTLASSIKNRRKSMLAESIPINKFSSDEEHGQDYRTKDKRTDHLPMDKFEKRNINKTCIDRNSNKTSETSSVDDRGYSYRSRDMYKDRSSRHHDNSSHRGRDKYDVSLKYRKQYSPERVQKRQHREYQDDYYRQERGRYQGRSLESPPPESYNRYQRHTPDLRSNYDKHSHDHEKNKYQYEEKYAAKNRLSNDYDEPHFKKQKMESFGNTDEHFKEDNRYWREKDSVNVKSIPEFSPHEYDMLRSSCQSPDFVHTDAASANPIKEIMATAAAPLEDPRETNKRYVVTNENGKTTLSTAVGRNIDLESVNKTKWNTEPVDIPAALVCRPSQYSDELVKDIYMDIDDPVTNLNLSMESGEVCETEDKSHEIHNKPKEILRDSQEFKISKQVTRDLKMQATNEEKESTSNIAKYRIPKMGQNNKNSKCKMDVPIIDLGESVPLNKNVYKKGASEDNFPRESLTKKQKSDEQKHLLPSIKKESKRENHNQITLTKIAIVADDLELSDDNSDHFDTNKRVVPEKVPKDCNTQIKEARKDDSENNSCNIRFHDTATEKTANSAEIKIVVEEEKTKESDSSKKQKNKKKKSKSKEMSKDSVESIDAIHVSEKKTRSKKEQEGKLKPKETKEKFSDLFGDSSSLMTPEDLGIQSYLPISEDAQDAVDLKINQIIDAPLQIDKEFPDVIHTQDSVEIKKQATIHDDNTKDVLQKTNTEDKEVVKDIKKKKSSKKKEETIDVNKLPPPVVYENLNPGTDSNDSDVVKTVIISTGIQPEITFENNTKEVIAKPTTDVEVNTKQTTTDMKPIPAIMEFKRQDILRALATSTPHKEFSTMNAVEADARTADVICDSDASKVIAITNNAEPEIKQMDTNTLDSHDAPDVRIFVKRRRKLVKRPPMT